MSASAVKRKAGDDLAENEEEEEEVEEEEQAAKKSKTDLESYETEKGKYTFELNNKRKVSVSKFQKRVMIDIREYYEQDGKMLPGKKGISLPVEQWNLLKSHIELIDEAATALD